MWFTESHDGPEPLLLQEARTGMVRFSTFVMVEGKFERDDGVRNVIGRKFSELKVRELVHASRDFH